MKFARIALDFVLASAALAGVLLIMADIERRDAEMIREAMAQRATDEAKALRDMDSDARLKAGCEIVTCDLLGTAKWTR